MRIAIRRPDGAWHFADSRTPFTPVGVNELDVVPHPYPPPQAYYHSIPASLLPCPLPLLYTLPPTRISGPDHGLNRSRSLSTGRI